MKRNLAIALLLMSSCCLSQEVRFGFEVGEADVNLDSDIQFIDGTDDYTMSIGAHVGYLDRSRVLVDLDYNSMNDISIFGASDHFSLSTTALLFGYQIKLNDFYLEPKIGYARWQLELREGALFNPGPEEEYNFDGADPLAAFTAGYRFNDLFGMSLSYKYLDFERGHANSYALRFDFKI